MNTMNGRNAPLSPVSLGGSEWSYPPIDSDPSLQNNRGQLNTPPDSAGSARAMNGFPSGPRSVGGPSPPPSVGRSSAGTNLYARSESGRSQSQQIENQDIVLAEHYVSLKRYLSATSRDGNPKPPPNKARDKLQRLTGVQFLELSTDVYDELKRRELNGRRTPNAPAPPDYLLPEENFHPKRNQARQKLSSLGPPRFRDLATDVFCELERRYPHFASGDIPRVGSPMSVRLPPSRSGTPVNGMNGYPPRGQSRRRPSEASSIRSMRNGPGPINGGYGVPPSPGLPNGDYGRPTQKQFQSNTIVPNKSTMVEEDDDPVSPMSNMGASEAYGMDRIVANQDNERNAAQSEADKKLIADYEQQVKQLRERVDEMEDTIKKKEDEINNIMDDQRKDASAGNLEKQEWDRTRNSLEDKLAEAQELNDSLQRELDRIQDEHANEMRDLREQVEEYRQQAEEYRQQASQASLNTQPTRGGDSELEKENEDLRMSLQEQQQVTEQVRREAQEFMREMRMLSQQSGAAWEKQSDLEKTIEELEKEVREWRNRYARTKTQLRDMRASSTGIPLEQDAGKFVREKGFVVDTGLVKDVHVTKFQMAIDELLQRARGENPDQVIDSMKVVVVSVRRISKDIDVSALNDEDMSQQHAKLKARVSSTANNLITASKNFASAAGISPVSLLDAAASHLVAAVVEMLRIVKIRTTPSAELEDDDDGTITPVESTGFFSPRSNDQSQVSSATSVQDSLPRPPAFQGLGGIRASVESSAYSPVNSPRESYSNNKLPPSRGPAPPMNGNGMNYMNKGLPAAPNNGPGGGMYGMRQQDTRTEDLKIYLEDQTAVLVQTIQNLVQLIRNDADINQVTEEINTIVDVVGQVVSETEALGTDGQELIRRLAACRERLIEAGGRGMDLAADGKDTRSREWRMWTQTLPPIAFEIARETKELVQRVDQLVMSDGADDFA
ncbi:protein SPA2 [Rhypophila decipiens]